MMINVIFYRDLSFAVFYVCMSNVDTQPRRPHDLAVARPRRRLEYCQIYIHTRHFLWEGKSHILTWL